MTRTRSPSPPNSDYEVGYGRPPKHTRFQPGQSGHKKGRSAGSKNFTTIFAEELARPVTLTENGKRRRMPKRQALAKQVINKALSNDARAAALVFDQIRRGDGSAAAPAAIDARRPESRIVMENIIRRIRMAAEADMSAEAPKEDVGSRAEDIEAPRNDEEG